MENLHGKISADVKKFGEAVEIGVVRFRLKLEPTDMPDADFKASPSGQILKTNGQFATTT